MNMPHTCIIIRVDESLGRTRAPRRLYHTMHRAFPCFVQPLVSTDEQQHAQRGFVVTHKIFFASNPGLGSADSCFIVWTDTAGVEHLLNYRGSHDATPGMNVYMRINVQEISTWPHDLPR